VSFKFEAPKLLRCSEWSNYSLYKKYMDGVTHYNILIDNSYLESTDSLPTRRFDGG